MMVMHAHQGMCVQVECVQEHQSTVLFPIPVLLHHVIQPMVANTHPITIPAMITTHVHQGIGVQVVNALAQRSPAPATISVTLLHVTQPQVVDSLQTWKVVMTVISALLMTLVLMEYVRVP